MSRHAGPRSSALLHVNLLFFSLVFSFLVHSFCGELRVFILKFSGRLGSLMMRPLVCGSARAAASYCPRLIGRVGGYFFTLEVYIPPLFIILHTP